MSAYAWVLIAHSYLRWGVLALALIVLASAIRGVRGSTEVTRRDERFLFWLTAAADTQLLLGLTLYLVLSPISKAFFADPSHAVHDHVLRFFGMEHAFMMVLAVVVLHAGRVISKRASSDRARHRRTAITVLTMLAVMVSSIPWPGLRHARPLFRSLGETSPRRTNDERACPPLYADRCAACHGTTGRGDGIAASALKPPPRAFTDSTWSRTRTDAQLEAVIHDGGAAHGLSPSMPAQPDLSDADLEHLAQCIRSFDSASGEVSQPQK